MPIYQIQSIQNERLKHWKRLQTRKGRKKEGTFLIEGERQLREAAEADQIPRAIMIKTGMLEQYQIIINQLAIEAPIYELSTEAFTSIVETESAQGIVAEVPLPSHLTSTRLIEQPGSVTHLILDGIQDPGNLGTLLRTASAMGVTAVWLGQGTVDPYNAKVVRSAAGALFHLPMQAIDLVTLLPLLQQQEIQIIGTSPHTGTYPFQYRFPKRIAILLGNEGQGVQSRWTQYIQQPIQIPMPGRSESYNVSITGAMLLYERMRQQEV